MLHIFLEAHEVASQGADPVRAHHGYDVSSTRPRDVWEALHAGKCQKWAQLHLLTRAVHTAVAMVRLALLGDGFVKTEHPMRVLCACERAKGLRKGVRGVSRAKGLARARGCPLRTDLRTLSHT